MADPYRVIVTGSRALSRDWADIDLVRAALDLARWDAGGPMVVVHGACPTGADAIASWWVRGHQRCGNPLELSEEPPPADWDRYGRAAGFRRNAEMVALGADLCLVFALPCSKPGCRKPRPHDSHGTAHCAGLARRAGITIRHYPPGGDHA